MRNHGAEGRSETAAWVDEFLSEAQEASVQIRKLRERQKRARKARRSNKNFTVRGFAPQNDSRQSQAQSQPDNSKEVT
jgi:hypothetical protein